MDRRRILPIFFIVFTNILGSGVILPILPLLAEGEFGASVFQATTLSAVFFAAQFVAAPWLGRLSDRIGRRPVLIVSQIGTVLSFVLFILAGPVGHWIDGLGAGLSISGGLLMLYIARTLDGVTGGNITTAQAYITDVTGPENRAQALGLIGAAFGTGFIFGPAFGGLLAEVSLVAPFWGAAIITSVSLLLTTLTLTESLTPAARAAAREQTSQAPLRVLLARNSAVLILAINFVVTLSFAALQSTFALYAERVIFPGQSSSVVARNAGLLLALLGVMSVLTQLLFIKPLVRRYGERNLAIIGQVSLAVAFGGLAAVTTVWIAALFTLPLAFGNSIIQPGLQALLTDDTEAQVRGRLLGLFQSSRSLALIVGPIWAGLVFQWISPRAPFVIAVPLLLVAVGMSTRLKRRDISLQSA